jgi:hypothetical protein
LTSRAVTIPACLALLAFTLTACGSAEPAADGKAATPTPSASKDATQEFRDWADNGGSDTLDTILTDLAAVQEASNPADLDALRKSCPTMTANLEVAKQGDTMPGPAGQRWTLALEHLAASAAACSEGAVSGDQAAFDLMASEMDIGISHITAVNKHLDEALGS